MRHQATFSKPLLAPLLAAVALGLVVSLAPQSAAGKQIPAPPHAATSLQALQATFASIGTDASRATYQAILDGQLLTPAVVQPFLRRIAAIQQQGGLSTPPWKEAAGYAYLLVRYLRFRRLDAVLATMRQLASGGAGAAPAGDEKLQRAASQLDLAEFVEWGRRVEQPVQKAAQHTQNTIGSVAQAAAAASSPLKPPANTKSAASPKKPKSPAPFKKPTSPIHPKKPKSPAPLKKPTSPAPLKKPALPPPPKKPDLKDPLVQFRDWSHRLKSMGGKTYFLVQDVTFKKPRPSNPYYNVGSRKFRFKYIGVVFHVMLFADSKGYLYPPQAYWSGASPARRMLDIVNKLYLYSGTNIQFYLKAYRADAKKYPYLRFSSMSAYQQCANDEEMCTCPLARKHNFDSSKYINIFVVGSFSYYGITNSQLAFGYTAAIPGELDICSPVYDGDGRWSRTHSPQYQHIWLRWDRLDPFNDNSVFNDNNGPSTLAHELGHAFGLLHVHSTFVGDCAADDHVADTPPGAGSTDEDRASELKYLCSDIGMFDYEPQASDVVMFDTCTNDKYVDNVWNIMSYSPALCRLHFTRGQVARMQALTTKYMPAYGKR